MFKTLLCDLLDIEYPILQGGMAWTATGELAAAVSQAGGLGIIGAGQAPDEWVLAEIRKVKSLTDKPFGVNIMLMSPFVDKIMEVIVREKVPVITTGAGNPGKYLAALKDAGTKIIPVVASVALAKRLERQGVDALIAEGGESGGHVGELTTMPLVPQIVDAVDIPVIAAGGIADGRGMLAALALGAAGVQMGTRFMCATECTIAPSVKEAIIKAKDRDTVVTGRSTGHPVRCLENKFTRELEKMEKNGATVEELEYFGTGKLKLAMVDGDVQYGSVMSGQIAGWVTRQEPAAAIIQDIIRGARTVLDSIHSRVRV